MLYKGVYHILTIHSTILLAFIGLSNLAVLYSVTFCLSTWLDKNQLASVHVPCVWQHSRTPFMHIGNQIFYKFSCELINFNFIVGFWHWSQYLGVWLLMPALCCNTLPWRFNYYLCNLSFVGVTKVKLSV